MRPTLASASVWVLAVLLVAGIVHISSVLMLPAVAARNSFTRLADIPPGRGFVPLSPEKSREGSLPFTDPGVTIAVCRFDLAAAPYRVRVDIDSEGLTSLAFHSRNGIVFHTLTDRAALRGRLDVLLGTAAQIDVAEGNDTEDVPTREVRLVSPTSAGLVFVRAMPPSVSGFEALKRRLDAAECGAAR